MALGRNALCLLSSLTLAMACTSHNEAQGSYKYTFASAFCTNQTNADLKNPNYNDQNKMTGTSGMIRAGLSALHASICVALD